VFKIRNPFGLIEQDSELKARIDFFEKIAKPIYLTIFCVSSVIIIVALIVALIKYG
jgi:hypothetical protein